MTTKAVEAQVGETDAMCVANFEFHAAGRTWLVPEYRLSRLRDGSLGVPRSEFRRIHLAISLAICGRPGPMSSTEFEFLCDVADVSCASVAELVGLDRSALTKWLKRKARLMWVDRSNLLKRWFLICLFADAIRCHVFPAEALAQDATVLPRLRQQILRSGMTFDITEHGQMPAGVSTRLPLPLADGTRCSGRSPSRGGATMLKSSGTMKRRAPRAEREVVQVIDLFSGCGGMSYGFRSASSRHLEYRVLGGLDIDRHANATYERMVGRSALQRDVRLLTEPARLKEALGTWGYDAKFPLLLIGCAPCQGFSSHRKKDKREDLRNELLSAFAEIACMLTPELVVMENVPEVLHKNHWEHFAAFRSKIAESGYSTRARLYNLASFGLPQERFRALVLASRVVQRTEMPLPLRPPSAFATVRDAIGHLPPLAPGEASLADPMHVTSRHRPDTVKLLSMIPQDGGSRRSLPAGVGLDCHSRVDGFRDVYGRLWWDRPAVAITARCRTPSCGRFAHPVQDRGLSVREAALLQGFPPEYVFEGPFDDKYKQIGNAVSPMFSAALAVHVDRSWVGEAEITDPESDIVSPIGKSISSALAGMKRRFRDDGDAWGIGL